MYKYILHFRILELYFSTIFGNKMSKNTLNVAEKNNKFSVQMTLQYLITRISDVTFYYYEKDIKNANT